MTEPVVELVGSDTLASRISELGREIATDYAGLRPVLVGVMKGAIPFLADLVRAIDIDLQVDFLDLTRFGESGRVRIAMDTEISLADRHVILVEDIVDTGLTLVALRSLIETRDPASVVTVALVDKSVRRLIDVPLEYRGFEVGDEFLLGYGLDWDEKYRNLTSLWAVLDLGRFGDDPELLGRLAFRTDGDSVTP